MNYRDSLVLQLAGISVAVHGNWSGSSPFEHTVFERFAHDGVPEVLLNVAQPITNSLPPVEGEIVFDVPDRWALYSDGTQHTLVQSHPFSHGLPVRMLIVDRDLTQGSFLVRSRSADEPMGHSHPHPLQYPLGEVLLVCLLAQRRGLMVHGCAIEHKGLGLLFAGNSGDGKSTLARLCANSSRVLNDDRVVIRESSNGYDVYPTPWHGDLATVTPEPARLGKVYFLRHGTENHVRPLTTMQASSMLLTRCFMPLWDKQGMEFTLDFAVNVVSRIPCWELTFVSDESVVDFLMSQ